MKPNRIDEALQRLRKLRRRLEPDQSRMKRRNARRAILGALRSVRHALDAEYPSIERPAAPPKPKPDRVIWRLPFRRAWDINDAKLFAAIAADTLGRAAPSVVASCWAKQWEFIATGVAFDPEWSRDKKWLQVVHHFTESQGPARTLQPSEAIDLWARFWTEQIPVSDLRLAAAHLALLEKRGRTTRR